MLQFNQHFIILMSIYTFLDNHLDIFGIVWQKSKMYFDDLSLGKHIYYSFLFW